MAAPNNSNTTPSKAFDKSSEPAHKVVLVTGGNRGIGNGIIRGIHKYDPKSTFIFSVRDEKKGHAAIEEFKAAGLKNVSFVVFDVTDAKAVNSAVESILKTHKRIDILVNNSGVILDLGTAASQFSQDLFNKTTATNVFGSLNMMLAVLPSMKANNFGRIIQVSSQMGSLGSFGESAKWGGVMAYRSSKAVLNLLTIALQHEVKDYNININAYNPGPTDTDMTVKAGAPKHLMRTVEQGADTGVWLATEAAVTSEKPPRGGFFNFDRQPLSF